MNSPSCINITTCDNLSDVTHVDLHFCISLRSDHLEQLAIACPNLHRFCLYNCFHCLESLQGLQAIASHCHNLQVLDLFGINVSKVEDHVLLWEILSGMKLTRLRVESCILTPKCWNKRRLIDLYKKCWGITGVEFIYMSCGHRCFLNKVTTMLSYFPLLHYCCVIPACRLPTIVQDVINSCKELTSAYFRQHNYPLSLCATHHKNLQKLHIYSPHTDVPDDFITSVSAHGGLVHVVMEVKSLTVEGITSLVRNSPELITLDLLQMSVVDVSLDNFNCSLKKMFSRRKLFTKGLYKYTKFSNDAQEI